MFLVSSFYQFIQLDDPTAIRTLFAQRAHELCVRGYVIFSHEGINATIAGAEDSVSQLVQWVEGALGCTFTQRLSNSESQPFRRMHTKVRDEIVQLGLPEVDPTSRVGQYVSPLSWNDLIAQDDVVLIDTRNEEEIAMGTFDGAIDPHTATFKQFPEYVATSLDPATHRKVAMFCTGGIRCEKATAYMLSQGFEEVYHLEGGILHYLETIPQQESMWRGECFVFDHRVSVDHQLKPGSYTRCYACWAILEEEDLQHQDYTFGVSCPACRPTQSPARRAALFERLNQRRLSQDDDR